MSHTASVIILNYKSAEDLPACLGGLLTQTFQDFEILLVDQGNKDGSTQAVMATFEGPFRERLKVLWAGRNLGFAGGCNLAFEAAQGKWVALLNADTVPSPAWLEALIKGANSAPNIGMCASRIQLLTNPGQIDNLGHRLYPDGLNIPIARGERDGPQFDEPEEVLCPSGAAGLYLMEAVREVGGFDDSFFAYGEDLDLGLSLRALGYTCLYCPEARVRHALSATWGRRSLRKAFYVERNRTYVALRHFPPWAIASLPALTFRRHRMTLAQGLGGRGPLASVGEAWEESATQSVPGARGRLGGIGMRVGALTRIALAGGAAMAGQVAGVLGAPSQLKARSELQARGAVGAENYVDLLKRFGAKAEDAAVQWLDGPMQGTESDDT